MDLLKNSFKKVLPSFLWNGLRSLYLLVFEFTDHIGPYMRKQNYCGMILWYNKGNGLVKRLKSEPVFEKDMSEAIVEELRKHKNTSFLDIGANIGLISLYVSSKIPGIRIDAFEPGLRQRELFLKTVSVNGLSNINIHAEALGDSVRKVAFYIHDVKNTALDGLRDTRRRGKTTLSEVSMITLDSWWATAKKQHISVIKIDTEGAELFVLRGAHTLINELKPVIFLEIEPSNLKAYPYNESDIKKFFQDIDYELETVTKDTFKARPLVNKK